ncbi:MAG: RraA family protein [Chloroflexi bacterium]|nr:RraA family protein [Chloroflexota bacterium]
MPNTLTAEQLEELRGFSSPTLSNAIELFGVRPRNTGFMGPEIRCVLPLERPMIGYACTGCIRAVAPADPTIPSREAYWDWTQTIPGPRIAVLQDLDAPKAVGSFWGEVNATVHKALGFAGTVTDGGVRDLDEVAAMGFAYFAQAVVVSHAYIHMPEFGKAVQVGGVTVRPGDLIHADKHGVLVIPWEVAPRLAEMARAFEAVEQEFIQSVRRPGFTLERLKADWAAFGKKRGALTPQK